MMKHLGELKEQLGWQGMSGIALLVLAGAFNFLVLQPMEQEAAYVHSRLDAVHAKSKLHGRTFDMGDRQKELGEFFDSLPDEQDVTDILGSISVIAEASGVQLKQAEYHLDEKSKPRLEYGMYFSSR